MSTTTVQEQFTEIVNLLACFRLIFHKFRETCTRQFSSKRSAQLLAIRYAEKYSQKDDEE
jgi:hypothetical protein